MEEAAELEELMILSDKMRRDCIVQKFGDQSNSVRVSSILQVCIAMPLTLLLIITDMALIIISKPL